VPASLRGARVYFEVSEAPHAAGAASFIGETLARLGLVNIVPAALGPFPQLNPEFIVRAAPDIVMATDRNLQQMRRRPGWSEMRALRNDRRCGFPSARYDVLVRAGPRLGEAAETIADCLVAIEARASAGAAAGGSAGTSAGTQARAAAGTTGPIAGPITDTAGLAR
jgi:iron complex transport system substrate-binding protein